MFSHGRPTYIAMIPTEMWNLYLSDKSYEEKKILFEKIPDMNQDEQDSLHETISNHFIQIKSQQVDEGN